MPYPVPSDMSRLDSEYRFRGTAKNGDIYDWVSNYNGAGVTLTRPTGEVIHWTQKPTLKDIVGDGENRYCRLYANGSLELRRSAGSTLKWAPDSDRAVIDVILEPVSDHTHCHGDLEYDCYDPSCSACPVCGNPYDGGDNGGHGCSRKCAYSSF